MSKPAPPPRSPRLPWHHWPVAFPVTFGISALTLAFFVLEWLLGGTLDFATHVRLGALRPDKVLEEGELFRLFMPMLLHHGPIHLVLNGLAFIQLMLLTEHLYGSARAFAFYVVSGLGASLATTLFSPPWIGGSVGASGAIMGLAGLLLGASWYGREPWRGRLRGLFGRRLLVGVLLTFAIGIGISLLIPIVDNWGHGGGFVTGLILAALNRDPLQAPRRFAEAGAGVLAASWLFALGWTGLKGGDGLDQLDQDRAELVARRAEVYTDGVRAGVTLAELVRSHHQAGMAREGRERLRTRLAVAKEPETVQIVAALLWEQGSAYDREIAMALDRWLDLAPDDPNALNSMAWHLVTRTHAAPNPQRAERLSRRSLELLRDPGDDNARSMRAAFLDTLAESLVQLDRLDEALRYQEEAVELGRRVKLTDLPELEDRLERIRQAQANTSRPEGPDH